MLPCSEKAATQKRDFYGLWHKDEAKTVCPKLHEESVGTDVVSLDFKSSFMKV